MRVSTLQEPYLVILTSPPLSSTHNSKFHFQSKRQLYSDADFEEYEENASQADLVEKYSAYLIDEVTLSAKKNGTNIFAPKPKSGLFHRYVFFTPTLLFG